MLRSRSNHARSKATPAGEASAGVKVMPLRTVMPVKLAPHLMRGRASRGGSAAQDGLIPTTLYWLSETEYGPVH